MRGLRSVAPGGWARSVVATTTVAALFLSIAVAEAAFIHQIRFEQYLYRDNETLDVTPPSQIGGCTVDFDADFDEGYLNVAAFIPGLSTDPQWIVHNLRLHPLGEGAPSESITSQFPLEPLGVTSGMPIGTIEYGYEVMTSPLLDADETAWLATVQINQPAAVAGKVVDVGFGTASATSNITAAGPDTWFSRSIAAGVDTVKSNIGCEMPNLDLDGTARTADVNACAPASAANSLEWLKNKHGEINFPHAKKSVQKQLEGLAGRTPPAGIWPRDLARAKLDFIEAHKLPIHVKIQDVSSSGNISSTSGRTQAEDKDAGAGSWPTRNFMFEEAKKGEDVEVMVSWYYWDPVAGQFKPSNFAHALVLTGAGTKSGGDYVKLKDDDDQHGTGGQLERDSGVTSYGDKIELPGLRIKIPSGPGAGQIGYPFVSSVISESKDTSVTPPPATEGFSRYCQLIKRVVPKGGKITFTFPDTGATRCYNATLIRRDPGRPNRDTYVGVWNFNRGKSRTWTNTGDYPMVVMLHNDDKAPGQSPYPGFDVGIAITDSTGSKQEDSPFNPQDYGGFSLGGDDGSSAEFCPTDLGPLVWAGPVDSGFDLGTVPSHLAVAGGTQELWIFTNVPGWNIYWENLGFVLDVLTVQQPGDLQVECPANGFMGTFPISTPGRYELTLGLVPPSPNFELRLLAQNGLDITLDAIGVPSLVPVDLTDAPSAAPSLTLAAAAPNPFNPRTSLRFALTRDAEVLLAVYDLRGRRVTTLLDGPLAAGEHGVTWDGVDDSGRPLPSGTYLCRLTAGKQVRTVRMTLLK
jgi:hypothetical protein